MPRHQLAHWNPGHVVEKVNRTTEHPVIECCRHDVTNRKVIDTGYFTRRLRGSLSLELNLVALVKLSTA